MCPGAHPTLGTNYGTSSLTTARPWFCPHWLREDIQLPKDTSSELSVEALQVPFKCTHGMLILLFLLCCCISQEKSGMLAYFSIVLGFWNGRKKIWP